MNAALLLDTHIALWLESGDQQLRPLTQRLLQHCWAGGGTLYLSAVSVWEIALLLDRNHIELDVPLPAWLERFFDRPGIEPLPLSVEAAAGAYRMPAYEYRDPADRLLMASAMVLDCPLVTYDERMAKFAQERGRQYRFTVSA